MKKFVILLPILMVLCALSTGAYAESLPFPQQITLGFEGVRLQDQAEGTNLGDAGITLPGGAGPYQGIASFENVILGIYGGTRNSDPTTTYGWATPNSGPIDSISVVIGGPLAGLDMATYFTNPNDFDGDGISSPAKFITDPLTASGSAGATSYKMVVNFASPVTDVAFYALDIDGVVAGYQPAVTAEMFLAKIYGEGGFEQEISVLGTDYNTEEMAYYVAFGNTTGITKLEMQFFRMDENGNYVIQSGGGGIDYLSFTPAAVPEPATMFLLGSGLIGIGVFMRKKFRK